MQLSMKNSERLTAILSTIVAVALLGAGVTAQQSLSQRTDDVSRLESDLRFQIRSAFRQTPNEAEQRLQQLDELMLQFHSQQRSESQRERLTEWLQASISRSIPGSIQPLPESPSFASDRPTASTVKPNLATGVRPLTQLAAPKSPVKINLPELSARIAGYHAALDELEARQLEVFQPTESAISAQLDALEGLAADYQFVKLYYDSLSPTEKRRVTSPSGLARVATSLGEQIRQLQIDVAADSQQPHGSALSKLQRRLESIAGRNVRSGSPE